VSAFRRPNRLKISPFFAIGAVVDFDMATIQRGLFGRLAGASNTFNYLSLNAFPAPSEKRL
jgi:hypothetical protein